MCGTRSQAHDHVKVTREIEIDEAKRCNDVVILRTPNGECLHDILLARGGEAKRTIQTARSEVLQSITQDPSHWEDNRTALHGTLPVLKKDQVRRYFGAKDTSIGDPSVITKAYRRMFT